MNALTVQDPNKIAWGIVDREGGYVNDPDDPGGATKWGVTIHTVRRLKLDKNNDGRITAADVKLLTQQDAVDIFLRHYLYKPQIDKLPKELQATVFDMYVNAGGNAIKILQRLINRAGVEPQLSVDGALGPKSLAAIQLVADNVVPGALRDAYGAARRNYYFRIADRRPASRKYARTRARGKGGWIKRAEEFMSTHYRMTDAEFAARTKAWG